MEVVNNSQLAPGDPRLVDHIVGELKSQGLFDEFRKECIADVDTKPAYQNLRHRVEGNVSNFLNKQRWKSNLNKNQVREMLRKNIQESGFFEKGVERIVDQVVNPKINTAFFPQVEDIVYNYIGMPKPEKSTCYNSDRYSTSNHTMPLLSSSLGSISPDLLTINTSVTDLLPEDLDPISPASDKTMNTSKLSDQLVDEEPTQINTTNENLDNLPDNEDQQSENQDDSLKADDDESPPFEPIVADMSVNEGENTNDSNLSGMSGLSSHVSDKNDSVEDMKIDESLDLETKEKKEPEIEDLPINNLSVTINENDAVAVESETSNSSKETSDLVAITVPKEEVPKESEKEITEVTVNGNNKEKEEDSKEVQKKDSDRSRHRTQSESKRSKDDKDKRHSRSSKNHDSKDSKDRSRTESRSEKSSESKSRDSKSKDTKDHKSSSSSSSKSHSEDKNKSSKKSSSSSSSSHKKSSSSSHKDSKSSHRDSSRDKKSKSDDRKSDDRKSSSLSSNRHSSSSSKDRSKHYSSSKSSSSHHKTSSSSSKKDSSSRKHKDDHASSRDKMNDNSRRSTDRDSNDGGSGPPTGTSSSQNSLNSVSPTKESKKTENSQSSGTNGSGDQSDSTTDKIEEAVEEFVNPISKPPVILDLNESEITMNPKTNGIIPNINSVNDEEDETLNIDPGQFSTHIVDGQVQVKLKKPKFASNFFEARRLMKIRKNLTKLERKKQRELNEQHGLQLRKTPSPKLETNLIQEKSLEPAKIDDITEETHPPKERSVEINQSLPCEVADAKIEIEKIKDEVKSEVPVEVKSENLETKPEEIIENINIENVAKSKVLEELDKSDDSCVIVEEGGIENESKYPEKGDLNKSEQEILDIPVTCASVNVNKIVKPESKVTKKSEPEEIVQSETKVIEKSDPEEIVETESKVNKKLDSEEIAETESKSTKEIQSNQQEIIYSDDDEDCLYFAPEKSPTTNRFLAEMALIQKNGSLIDQNLIANVSVSHKIQKAAHQVRQAGKINQNLSDIMIIAEIQGMKRRPKVVLQHSDANPGISSGECNVSVDESIETRRTTLKRKRNEKSESCNLDNNNTKKAKSEENHYHELEIKEEFLVADITESPQQLDSIKTSKRSLRNKRSINNQVNESQFTLPLSPESDVSVSPIEPKSNSKIMKDSKNEPISKVAKIVKEESKSTPTRVAGKNDKSCKSKASSAQRYSSDDLYKPRPVIGFTRRSRAAQSQL